MTSVEIFAYIVAGMGIIIGISAVVLMVSILLRYLIARWVYKDE